VSRRQTAVGLEPVSRESRRSFLQGREGTGGEDLVVMVGKKGDDGEVGCDPRVADIEGEVDGCGEW